ncbi:MAG TPA: endonuclease domain-containing protein, partial [Polyangiaceae bacterium]|nr:endonuclease domain-containing protein [Polyangiaceae bacterium]
GLGGLLMSRRYQPLSPAHAVIIAAHARCMRQAPSASEQALWAALSGSELGVGFRRQYRVGTFIADFAAPSRKLIVEVDGGYHVERTGADASRDAKLRRLGWRVLRFLAKEVLGNLPQVIEAIRVALNAHKAHRQK